MVISTPFPPVEGIGNHVFNVSKKLIERGHRITIITRGSSTKTARKIIDNIRVIETNFIPIYPFHVWLHCFFLEKEIKKLVPAPDIIHIHTPLAPYMNTSAKVISTVHSSLVGDAFQMPINDVRSLSIRLLTFSIGKHLISELIRKSEIVTTVSKQVSNEIEKYYNVDKKPVIIGNAVDQDIFVPPTEKNPSNYVLYVGRLGYGKGLFDLLKCAKMFSDSDLSFILVGSGELEPKIRKIVQLAKLENKIILKGQVTQKELSKLYQNAIALVISSSYESGPQVLLESMMCGTPVISTRVGLVPDIIKDWENGIIIPFKSPKSMAEAISILHKDQELRNKIGSNARKSISGKYTWDKITDLYEQCYHLVCEDK
jgi:glycosyltransferase involved in cell wall biosynthesis